MYSNHLVSYKTQQRQWAKSLDERLLQWVEKLIVKKAIASKLQQSI